MARDRVVELRRVRAGDLRPDPRNWRRHPPGQRAALSRMLDRLGYVDAVIARETSDGLVLVDGHLRAGMSPDAQIPVLVVDLDHSEAGEVLATLDPLAAMAEADRDALTRLLSDLDVPPPIDLKEMYALAPEPAELKPADVEPILPSEPVSRCGDLWLLGRHRLMCGDATERSQVTRLLDGAQPSLMVTDPPYGVAYDASWRKKAFGSSGGRLGKVRNDDDPSYWAAALEACKTPVAYIWSPSGENVLVFGRILQAAGYGLRNQIIWRKPKMVISRGHYHWQHECLWYGVLSGKTAKWRGDRSQTTVWDITWDRNVEGGHSTQKPVECMERPLRNHEGDVYDPFVGSGTSIIAAERQNRTCYAMEIDPAYVDAAVTRWEAYTGGAAAKDEKRGNDGG